MEWITTSTILERLHDYDDRSVWGAFAERFRRPVISFARKSGLSRAEAEDVTQEALLAFAEAYRDGKYDPAKGRLSSWLFGIAYRQIANWQRKQHREQKKRDQRGGHTSFWSALPGKHEASKVWDAEWEKAVLDNCMRQAKRELTERTFLAFELVVRQGHTASEAAQELDMSRDAVYVAKHRVLKRLAELTREYEDPSFSG